MKKSIGLIAVAALFAIGSAFTTKAVFNATGWADDSLGNPVSGPTNDSGCQVQTSGTECFIVVDDTDISPVYDSQTDIGVASKILRTSTL